NAGNVLLEVAEHLIGVPRYRMAPDAAGPAEEEHRASLLRRRQRLVDATRITIDRRISVDLRELELGDRTAEIVEGDWRARLHMSKHAREELPIVLARVEAAQDLVPNVVIVTGEVEPGGLDPLCGRNERLRREQVRQGRRNRRYCRMGLGTTSGSASSTSVSDRKRY